MYPISIIHVTESMRTPFTSISGYSHTPLLSKSRFCIAVRCLGEIFLKMSSFCRVSLSALRCTLFHTHSANRLIPFGTTVIRSMSAGTAGNSEVTLGRTGRAPVAQLRSLLLHRQQQELRAYSGGLPRVRVRIVVG